MATLEEFKELRRDYDPDSARRMANTPGGGMIKPNDKYFDFQHLTAEEEAEIDAAWTRNERSEE